MCPLAHDVAVGSALPRSGRQDHEDLRVKESLLEILCEPGTGSELRLEVEETDGEDVREGSLRSDATGKRYPIRAGIPRFVPEDDYCSSFDLQWNRFARVQLDSANGADYSHRRFEEEVGWRGAGLQEKWVLDGGCGCCRPQSLQVSQRPLLQGDLLQPPVRRSSIPYVYSIGVLHHTSDPATAVRSLLSLVSPGGSFAMTIYGRRWYTRLYSKYLLRPVTRRLRPESLLRSIEVLMPVLFPVTDVVFRLPLLGKVAQFLIPVANYVEKTDFSVEQRKEEAILDTFDMLSPAFDKPMSTADVKEALGDCGIEEYLFEAADP